MELRNHVRAASLLAAVLFSSHAWATDLQGVLADWDCVKSMVQNGRAKTLKENHSCSLDQNYSRNTYGIITDDKRYFKLDDAGRTWALKLLRGTSDKDDLHVILSGTIDGDTVHVDTMSEL